MKNILFLSLLFVLFSCGNSVEKQEKNWKSNEDIIDNYSSKYPSFKDEIYKQYQKANEEMVKALQMSNEEEKIDAMKKANSMVTSGVIESISKVEKKIEDVKSDMEKLKDELTSEEFSQKTTFFLETAISEVNRSETVLNNSYSSIETALKALNRNITKLTEVEKSLEKHYKEVIDLRSKEKKAKEESKSNEPVESN